ncbi:glycoside hydrolase family 3 N-terminal domain-containing protein [Cognatishimia activa]|uniref:beta-N-acetylhexosaminidase n=1 Tax=Cognatishimia activa TaxID=1715691 RepID=A0A0N7MC37_9RHOB|nr:glycoside hydrolase family 3 N-terminal domain-containing protein [Cognatishimia activa]CUJ33166.1 Beta-hexosaminidase [Cognatishimia activa]CUK27120.1 Beta-hexosaminidase [Cognatishimia activa]
MTQFGATILGCEGLSLTANEKAFFADAKPFAFILFSRNIDTADQIRALCAELRASVGYDAPILIDQEGGRVQRLRSPIARDWLPPLDQIMKAGENAARSMYIRSRIQAHELRDLGIDSNCAPLVDVAVEATHPFLKNRCYGFDKDSVSEIGRAVSDGHLDGGVLPVLKHIPGHGRSQVDSHLDLPTVAASREELATDFAPFKALNDLPMGMTAHLVYEAIDDQPATISPTMMGLIRNEIGFDGLIMTDDISMEALSGSVADRSAASIKAGCDVVLHCNGDMDEMVAVATASGTMTELTQSRANAALSARKAPKSVDIDALTAELETYLSE